MHLSRVAILRELAQVPFTMEFLYPPNGLDIGLYQLNGELMTVKVDLPYSHH